MSRGERIFLGIAIAWCAMWGAFSWLFFAGVASHEEEADRIAMPVTPLAPGDVRIDGVVADVEESVIAPLSQAPCAAARTDVHYRTAYSGAQGRTHHAFELVTTLVRPRALEIRVESERVELPLEYWQPPRTRYADTMETFDVLPDRLGVAEADIARAKANNEGEPAGFTVDEWTLRGGEPLFVIGRVEVREGKRVLLPRAGMENVELYRGSRADVVEHLRGEASGLRIAGSVFVGIAMMLLVPFAIVRVRRRRSARNGAAT